MAKPAAKLPSFWISSGPALVVLLVALLLAAATIWKVGGDPLALARIGTRFSQGDPGGSEGYDGQFVYYIARDPDPQRSAPYLDVPAYRYQRILLPLLARLLAAGNPAGIPWTIILWGILSLVGGTWATGELLASWHMSRWYALIYGLWAGFTLALVVDLPEPLAYGLAAAGLLALERGRKVPGWILMGLALFAKEVILAFVIAISASYLFQRRWKEACQLALVSWLPFGLFQLWLWGTFGKPGIGSGGLMATSFELIPYMGLIRIAHESLVYFLGMAVVFGPALVFPSVWGMWRAARDLLAGERNVYVFSLLIHALVIAVMPFSTFRETGGVLRYACGLVLAIVLFAGRYNRKRVLNYAAFWGILNVFLLK